VVCRYTPNYPSAANLVGRDSEESAPPEFPPEQPEADLNADGDPVEGEDAAMAGAEDTAGPANDEDAESDAGSEEIDIEDSEGEDEEEEGEEGGEDDMEMDDGEGATGEKQVPQQPGVQQQHGADVMVH
jgi:histone chaperone ASF1